MSGVIGTGMKRNATTSKMLKIKNAKNTRNNPRNNRLKMFRVGRFRFFTRAKLVQMRGEAAVVGNFGYGIHVHGAVSL